MPVSAATAGVVVCRAADRFVTSTDWLQSHHSFSFGAHYDPGNTHHGLLLVHNEDRVQPGAGFDSHRHQDLEIVTWVLSGSLAHRDSAGNSGLIRPGQVQRLSAGSGVQHAERNGSQPDGDSLPARYLQMWLSPERAGDAPSYQQADVAEVLLSGALVPVVSGLPRHRDAVRLGCRAALHVARLPAGRTVQLPDAAYLHLFLATGQVQVEEVGSLGAGDAARFSSVGGHRVSATQPAELLVWEMQADLTG